MTDSDRFGVRRLDAASLSARLDASSSSVAARQAGPHESAGQARALQKLADPLVYIIPIERLTLC
jgi:hypothetical protein